jgi:hypothetical protein
MPSPPTLSVQLPSAMVDGGSPIQSLQRTKRGAPSSAESSPILKRLKRTTHSLVKSLRDANEKRINRNDHGDEAEDESSSSEDECVMVHEWTDVDDAILLAAIQASSSIEDVVQKGYLINHFTAEEIKVRWHAIIYDQSTAAYGRAAAFAPQNLVSFV